MGSSIFRRLKPGRRVQKLFFHYHKDVVRVLARRGLTPAEVEDELQMVFMTAYLRWTDIPTDDEEARLWLLGIARKRGANARRRFYHRYEIMNERYVNEAIAPPEDPEEQLASAIFLKDVARDLSHDEQDLVVSHFLMGESFAQLAARLRISKTSAHLRLTQAHASFVERAALLMEEKKERSVGFPLVALFFERAREAFERSFVSRWRVWGRMRRSSFWSLQVLPNLAVPLLGVVLGVIAARSAIDSPPHLMPTLTRWLATMPNIGLLHTATSDVDSASTSSGVQADALPSSERLKAAPDTDEARAFQQIQACTTKCPVDEALALILQYTMTYPRGRYEREVKALQRDWLRKKTLEPAGKK